MNQRTEVFVETRSNWFAMAKVKHENDERKLSRSMILSFIYHAENQHIKKNVIANNCQLSRNYHRTISLL